ncbi:MAG: amino acid ABC transporter substrate-binding protein [Aeromicrobium sp.]
MRTKAVVALVGSLALLAGCSPGDDDDETVEGGTSGETVDGGTGGQESIVVGLTVSETGALTAESTSQFNGLTLWADQVNEAEGIQVGDDRVTVNLASYDDESAKTRVQQLYTRLIDEDGADFLISPYSSGLTEAAAVVAEQNEKVMLAVGAASDSIFQQGLTHVFQIYTPASRYLTGSLDLLRDQFPDATRVAIVHEEDTFSTDVAEATREFAEAEGMEVVLLEGYPSDTTDFGPFISRVTAANPDALVGGGHFQDGTTLVRQVAAEDIPLDLLSILVAPSVPEFTQLGDAAVGVVGPSQWEPGVSYSEDAAEAQDLEWFGPGVEDVVTAYEERFGEEPGYHAIGGYVSGLLLQHAIETAGSLSPDAVKKVLEELDAMTVWGHLQFSNEEGDYGRQIGHEMVQIQWQRATGGEPERQIVWPPEAQTTEFQPIERG